MASSSHPVSDFLRANGAYSYVLVAIVLWATTAAASKILLTGGLTSTQVVFFWSLLSIAPLFIAVLWQKKLHLHRAYTLRDYLRFAAVGGLGVFLYNFLLLSAFARLAAQEAFLINYLWPIMVVIFGIIILRDTFTLRTAFALLLSFAGVAIIAMHGNLFSLAFSDPLGVLFAVAGAVCYGLFGALDKKAGGDKIVNMLVYSMPAAAVSFLVMMFSDGFPALSLPQFLGLMWLGVAAGAIGFTCWLTGLSGLDTARASNLVFLTPFLSLVFIRIFVGEAILLSSVGGLMLILCGIIVSSLKARRRK